MSVQFGISRFAAGTYGITQSFETEDMVDTETYPDVTGNVQGYQAYNRNETMSAEFVFDDAQAAPAAGAEVSMNGNKYVMTSVRDVEASSAFRRVTLSGQRWVTNTIPA